MSHKGLHCFQLVQYSLDISSDGKMDLLTFKTSIASLYSSDIIEGKYDKINKAVRCPLRWVCPVYEPGDKYVFGYMQAPSQHVQLIFPPGNLNGVCPDQIIMLEKMFSSTKTSIFYLISPQGHYVSTH